MLRVVALFVCVACAKKPPEPVAIEAAATIDASWKNSPGCDFGDAERCKRECDEGNHVSCANLGMMLIGGKGIDPDPDRGRAVLTKSCDAGDPLSCSNLGNVYENGWSVPRDMKRAADLYERSCNSGSPIGCGNFAVLLGRGDGRPRDAARARSLLQSACAQGETNACDNLRTMPE